jgi:hypothetical protein
VSWSTASVSSSILSSASLIRLNGMRKPASWMEMFSERFGSIRLTALGRFDPDAAWSFFFRDASSSANSESRSARFNPTSSALAPSHTVPRRVCGWSLSQ